MLFTPVLLHAICTFPVHIGTLQYLSSAGKVVLLVTDDIVDDSDVSMYKVESEFFVVIVDEDSAVFEDTFCTLIYL